MNRFRQTLARQADANRKTASGLKNSARWWGLLLSVCGLASFCTLSSASAQEEISVVRELALQGTVDWIAGDQLVLIDADGKRQHLKIQTDALKPIMLAGNPVPVNAPANIRVTGAVDPSVLDTGMVVEATCSVTRTGQVSDLIRVELRPPGAVPTGIEFTEGNPEGRRAAPAVISGQITVANRRRITVEIPRHPEVNRNRLTVDISGLEQVEVDFDLTGMIRKGDIVTALRATEVSTGDIIARGLNVELVGVRSDPGFTLDQKLQLKYAHLPNDPLPPREETSKHFILRTDLSQRRTAILLDKLETMVELINQYYGRKLRQPIQCIVISNMNGWDTSRLLNNPVITSLPNVDPQELLDRALRKVRNGEGITIYGRMARNQAAVVFSAADDSDVQHEAVHGYCSLVFGSTGPLWYAEGMAEVGQFWEKDNLALKAHPAIMGYLRDANPESMRTIINAERIDGDAWKAYAWRWVLCHMLVHNPNYSRQIRRLGMQLMSGDQASFENTFGSVANEISFEYLQFLEHLNPGLRADLIAWEWEQSPRVLSAGHSTSLRVDSKRGWQSSGVLVEPGVTYELTAEGTWQTGPTEPETGADGQPDSGTGKLVGILMQDYQLSEEFELGANMQWTAPGAGVLYLRCRESLERIADNQGQMDVRVKRLKQD